MCTTLGCLVYSFTWVFMRVFCSPLMAVTTILGCFSVTVLLLSLEDPGLGPPQDRNQMASSLSISSDLGLSITSLAVTIEKKCVLLIC